MKIGTLFSGIGSPEQAASRVWKNHEIAFACEWDKHARQSYKAIYEINDEHFFVDVREMDGTKYQGKCDILIGGSPCQAFSIAGLRQGTDDERGQLIYQYIRIVEEIKAPVIVYENVKGMMSINAGKTIKEFVQALRDIGYYCHYNILNTKNYGVPQNRERLFIVGFLDHEAYYRFQFAPKIPLTKRLKDVLESEIDEKYYLSHKLIETLRSQKCDFQPHSREDESAKCLTARYAKSGTTDPYINEGVIGMLNIKGNECIRRVYGTDGTAPCLQTMQGGNREPKIQVKSATKLGFEVATLGDSINLSNPKSETRRGRVGKQVAQTLDCSCNQAVVEPRIQVVGNTVPSGHEAGNVLSPHGISSTVMEKHGKGVQVYENYKIRKLTPLECWRLQDFPDEAHEKAKEAGVSDSQRYKQAGNSMTVAVVEMIFRQIDKALKGEYCGGQGSLF